MERSGSFHTTANVHEYVRRGIRVHAAVAIQHAAGPSIVQRLCQQSAQEI